MAHRHLRVAPWQGDPRTVLVAPSRRRRSPTRADIEKTLNSIIKSGKEKAVTPALNAFEAEPFFQAGFELYERLHLLAMDLTTPAVVGQQLQSKKSTFKISTGRRIHRSKMLEVDASAFQGFWQFDNRALNDAITATPNTWSRVGRHDGEIVGYSITGRAEQRGYLQRLAVNPEMQGRGLGTALVFDSARWLRKQGASMVLVNTQESNLGALQLYERLGFTRQRDGLVVLRWDRGR